MNPTTRRRFLYAGCGTIALPLAGCLGTEDVLSTRNADDPTEYEIVQYSTALAAPDWREHNDRAGHLDVFASAAAAEVLLESDRLADERRGGVESFIAATDFEETVLLYIASVGPNTCYNRIEVRELERIDATLAGEMAAADTSEPGGGCGGAVTHPSALVRPEVTDRAERVEITIIDGWGGRETITRSIE